MRGEAAMDEKLQRIESDKTSEIRALIRREIITLAVLFDKLLSAEIYDLWFNALHTHPKTRNLSAEQFRVGFAKIKATFKPTSACQFPTPAHFFETIEKPIACVEALVGEEAWEAALNWIRKWWHADLGVDRRAPPMDEKQRRAAMAAGGFYYLTDCTLEELQWAKKRFIENYGHQETIERDGDLIGGSEAKRILDGFRKPLPPRPLLLLPSKTAEEMRSAPEPPTASLIKEIPAFPIIVRTPESDRRTQEQIEQLKRKYPEAFKERSS